MPTFTHTPTGNKVFFAHIPRTAGRYVEANFLWRNDFTWDELPLDTGNGVMTTLHGAEIAHWHNEIYEEHLTELKYKKKNDPKSGWDDHF